MKRAISVITAAAPVYRHSDEPLQAILSVLMSHSDLSDLLKFLDLRYIIASVLYSVQHVVVMMY